MQTLFSPKNAMYINLDLQRVIDEALHVALSFTWVINQPSTDACSAQPLLRPNLKLWPVVVRDVSIFPLPIAGAGEDMVNVVEYEPPAYA